MKTILAISDYYAPAVRGGGAPHALSNMIEWLGDDYQFKIITNDFDLGSTDKMPSVSNGIWSRVGRAQVRYLSHLEYSNVAFSDVIRNTSYSMIYLNSLFGRLSVKTVVARKMRRIPNTPVIITPMGELYEGALNQKRRKKQVFLTLMKSFGAYKNVLWHASTLEEAEQIMKHIGAPYEHIRIAPLLPAPVSRLPSPTQKRAGELRMIFLSRITPKKNLDGALRILMNITHEVQFDIYGTQEDSDYWALCESLMGQLPPNIRARYRGAISDEQIDLFSDYHLFLFPTHGENFGYVIQESLLGGCLPLISTNTPWRGLADKRVGWDVTDESEFVRIIEQAVHMDGATFAEWSKNAQTYGMSVVNDPKRVAQNRDLFR